MNQMLLKEALNQMKSDFEEAIKTATYINTKGKKVQKDNGQKAKEALIRSSTFINKIHEVVKESLNKKLLEEGFSEFKIHPPIGKSSPELDVWGFLKKKKQDIVVTFKPHKQSEKIKQGPLINQIDKLGKKVTEKSIVIGVRSQLSSIDNNFDTLMERAFAEAMNLHIRHPELIMGEVYLLIVKEYDKHAMEKNEVKFVDKYTNVERFISLFNGISHRKCKAKKRRMTDSYKYESSSLLLVDFSQNPVKIYTKIEELKADGIVSEDFNEDFVSLSPIGFTNRLLNCYKERHGIE